MPLTSTCTAQLRSGEFCDQPALDSAPFPICPRHARQVYEWATDALRERPKQLPIRQRVIYYMLLLDGLIKIGTTDDTERRLTEYPPGTELLATEPGDFGTEANRLRRFNEYLAHGREYFTAGPRLMAHIAELSAGRSTSRSPEDTSRPRSLRA